MAAQAPLLVDHRAQAGGAPPIARKLTRRDDGIYLRMQHTRDEAYVRGEFQLQPEDGAALMQAVHARIPKYTPFVDWEHHAARALVEVVHEATSKADGARAATVLVSVTPQDLAAGSDGVAELSSGGFVGAETARRLACDAWIQAITKDTEGNITGVGRTTRTIPPSLRRAVYERDGGRCTFPGCEIDRNLEIHHITHVADGGRTELSNLQLGCWTHHELVHEGGWSLRGQAGPDITWIRPDGTPFEPRVRVTLDTS